MQSSSNSANSDFLSIPTTSKTAEFSQIPITSSTAYFSQTPTTSSVTDFLQTPTSPSTEKELEYLENSDNDNQNAKRRELNKLNMRKRRMALHENEKIAEREQDQIRKANKRANFTDEELDRERELDRIRKTKNREQLREKNGELYRKASERNNIVFYELKPFDVECIHCGAMHFYEEKPNYVRDQNDGFFSCCNYGKFKNLLDLIDDYPTDLKNLYEKENRKHKNFVKDIRKYNNSFACASLACNRFNFESSGPPCFKISGQVYHKFNQSAQILDDGVYPTNGQLYFVDVSEAQSIRSIINNELDTEIIAQIEVALRNHYPFAKAYEMMKDVIQEQERIYTQLGQRNEVKMLFSLKEGFDPNKYNVPRSNEVAAIMVCNASDEVPPANIIVVEKNTKNLINVYPLDPIVEPLTYPMLYPYGTKGWNFELKDSKGKRISLCDFTKFKLFFRNNKYLPHHYSKKLFQQWIVDQCARIEWNRLNYIKSHQKELRAGNYKGLEDYLTTRTEQNNVEIGKQVILPSSFVGGARNMEQNYIDALSIVGETGKPDIFITYTCNPEDPDIVKCLFEGQIANDRPDVVARVFKLKMDKLIEEVVKKELFGKVVGYCWVVEFQKRGLPHLHFLVTLDHKDKIRNKDDVDKYISAELPDKAKEPYLRELVKKFMMHGPCGKCRPEAPCMRYGKCRFKFPKKFNEETQLGDDGYALYKRSNNGEYEYNKGIRLTNQNIAPYNPYLLMRFKAHINVEICSEISAVKYIYKYIYKGYDSATVECVHEDENGVKTLLKYDEVGKYLEARYLSPIEACYRIFKYDLQGKSHSIERLEVHLENEQMVYFTQDAKNNDIEESMAKDSKLMAYFQFFKENPDAPKYKYIDMPKYCTFDQKTRKWKWPRKGHYNTIGRMYTINPKHTELYYLRYLLLHVHASSFSDLKTVNGIKYDNFAQSCLARGLTKDDAEWDKCLEEASKFKFPTGLRTLFVNILLNCDPKYPELLWEKYKDILSQDLYKIHLDFSKAYENCLAIINQKLTTHDKALSYFKGMPQLSSTMQFINNEDIYDPKDELELAVNKYNRMNDEQKLIFDEFKNILNNSTSKETKCLYIDGPGGTGKSFIQTAIYHYARGNNKKVCNMAFSGIASTLLKKGRTVHNRFKLPLDIDSNSTSSIEIQSKEAKEVKEINVFVWDEAPMAPRFALEIVDKKLKEIHQNENPFGGNIIVCSGDKRQVLPIKRKGTRTEIVNLLISNSKLWKHFKVMHLTKNMRSDPNANAFAEELLAIGNGTFGDGDYIKLPDQCYIGDKDLANEIFSEIVTKRDFPKLCTHCILAPYNREVNEYNESVLAKFPGDYITLYSIDEAESKSGNTVLPELLHVLECSSLPNHELKLKINCIVMLIRNINVEEGLCNGTRLQILDINKNVLRAMIITGDRTGEIVFIPRITLIEDKQFPYVLRRHQYPIRLAFCMTINKSQAQTFEKVGIDFQREVFAHGQTYVSVSRGKSWEKIRVKINIDNMERKIKNIVWKEAL